MAFQMLKAKTIGEIYNEVRGYDFVVTNEISLATALNHMVDTPRVGVFAATPRQIASSMVEKVFGRSLMDEVDVISAISAETGFEFGYVHAEIENIRRVMRYTDDVSEHLAFDTSRRVYEEFSSGKYSVVELVMSGFGSVRDDFYSDKRRVAVVGFEHDGTRLFDNLDAKVLPGEYTDVSMFTVAGERYQIPEIYRIGNDRRVAANAVALIDKEKADSYAVVVDTESPVVDAVKSALYREGIPFINRLNARDLLSIRNFTELLRFSLDFNISRVSDVRGLLRTYCGYLDRVPDDCLLSAIRSDEVNEKTNEILGLMRRVSESEVTFSEVSKALHGDRQVEEVLRDTNMTDRVIDADSYRMLVYAVTRLDSVEHGARSPESERSGVLFVDCKNSVYIDRPVVIYLGMGPEWDSPVSVEDYVDPESEVRVRALKMAALLQQGDKRAYLVNTVKNGEVVAPALLMDTVYGASVRSFKDICGNLRTGSWVDERKAVRYEKESVEVDPEACFNGRFSKSSLNSYVKCPHSLLFHRTVGSGKTFATEFGNIVHEFAEALVCYGGDPDFPSIEEWVDVVSPALEGLSSPASGSLVRSDLKASLKSVSRFLSRCAPRSLDRVPLGKRKNRFIEYLGRTEGCISCECDVSSKELPLHGQFDLLTRDAVVDYKTGVKKKADAVIKSLSPFYSGIPELQPMVYLTLAQEIDNSPREFELYFTKNDRGGIDTGDFDPGSSTQPIWLDLSDCDLSEFMKTSIKPKSDLYGCIVSLFDGSVEVVDSGSKSKGASNKLDPRICDFVEYFMDFADDDPENWIDSVELRQHLVDWPGGDRRMSEDVADRCIRLMYEQSFGGATTITLGDKSVVQIPYHMLHRYGYFFRRCSENAVRESGLRLPVSSNRDCKKCQYRTLCVMQDWVSDEQDEEGDE